MTSTDSTPFGCDQQPRYRQRAQFDVVVTADADASAFTVHETAVRTEPSPCDHGFRHLGDYRAALSGRRMVLTFDDGGRPGTETLHQVDDLVGPLPEPPWPARYDLAGPWRWQSTVVDTDGNYRDETEWWEVPATPRLTRPTGGASPCAARTAHRWRARTRRAGRSTTRTCWPASARRSTGTSTNSRSTPATTRACARRRGGIDQGTAEQIGDYVVIEWRGKRRQVLICWSQQGTRNEELGTWNGCRHRTGTVALWLYSPFPIPCSLFLVRLQPPAPYTFAT